MQGRSRPAMVFRGSRRRLRRIRVRDNWSREMVWLGIWIVIVLCLVGRLVVSTNGDRTAGGVWHRWQPSVSADDRR